MIIESSRILLGVAMVCFHRQIGQFMHAREQELAVFMGRRGVRLPNYSERAMTDTYFCLGVAALLLAVAQLWFPV